MYLETASVTMKWAALARRENRPAAFRAVRAGWRMAGGQAYGAARGALRSGRLLAALRHIFYAARWAPRATTIALLKFPFQRLAKLAGAGGGRATSTVEVPRPATGIAK